MESKKIFIQNFTSHKCEPLKPAELNALIALAQKGSLKAQSLVLNSMRQWIGRVQKMRVFGVVNREDLYDFSIDAILLAIGDYDPKKGLFTTWCTNKLGGRVLALTNKSKRIALEPIAHESQAPCNQSSKENKDLVMKILAEIPEQQADLLTLHYGLKSGVGLGTDVLAKSCGKNVTREAILSRIGYALKSSRAVLRASMFQEKISNLGFACGV